MSQKRVVLTTLFVTSVLIPFIHFAQISLPLSSTAFRLPIAPGLNLYVSQGNNDTQHDHVGKAAWAFDFIVGQTNFGVTATQGGKVIIPVGSSFSVILVSKDQLQASDGGSFILCADDPNNIACISNT